MTMPSNKWEETLVEILAKLPQYNLGDDPVTDEPFTPAETLAIYPELKEAKLALTNAVKELVVNARPDEKRIDTLMYESKTIGKGARNVLDEFQLNLLKAIGDK